MNHINQSQRTLQKELKQKKESVQDNNKKIQSLNKNIALLKTEIQKQKASLQKIIKEVSTYTIAADNKSLTK